MLTVRKSAARGHADYGWLRTFHTFSFNEYYDLDHMQFRSLRVMNEDWIAPDTGFGTHPHRNMEIVTYVMSGVLNHRDSMGYEEQLHAGEFQRISAGSGITHSEFNASKTEPVHLYQIWLLPSERNLEPSYEQKKFDSHERQNRFRLVASPDAAEQSLAIHTDARIYLASVEAGRRVEHSFASERHGWLQTLRGKVRVNEFNLEAGDGLSVSDCSRIEIEAEEDSELMLFDLA